MKVVCSFNRQRLIDNNIILAMITEKGLVYISPSVNLNNIKSIKKFIEDYQPLGFVNKESERIYYRNLLKEEESLK
nr:MAG TPA: hypothetical protein [Bacteriophage sp.]